MGIRVVALQERAEELGFGSIQEALDAGYEVEYRANGDHYLRKPTDKELADRAYNEAHKAWLKEKESVLADLRLLLSEAIPLGDQDTIDAMERAIDFVEGCHD